MFFYIFALVILLIDQFLKYLVHQSIALGQSIPLIDGMLKLTYVQNTGAAFSLFVGFSPYLVVVGIIVVLAVIYFHYKIPARNYYLQTSLAFILGGSLGNLVDRVVRSYVIDYVDVTIWPVFNFADVMINVGVICLVIQIFVRRKEAAKYHVSSTD